MAITLYLGNVNYSSWSLRAWLALRWAGVPFEPVFIELDQPGYGEQGIAEVLAVSPSGQLPALRVGEVTVWDALAIAEWAADWQELQGSADGIAQAPTAGKLRPADAMQRALMRAHMAEMHAGFSALRQELPVNIRRRCQARGLSARALADVSRVTERWTAMRQRHATQGPWLLGARSLADAFWLPVATRFRTYGVTLPPLAAAYRDTLLADADFAVWQQWIAAVPASPFSRAPLDSLYTEAVA